ncbi:MAG: ribosome biogenesis protein [Candidatus Aenigmarchaeota archaeon]|nr:ribosome biogenesis protein [Candidatus Aenigmarchaeota archaeon]
MKLRICDCGYTLQETCPMCSKPTRSAHPPKFSSVDKFGAYRRRAKQAQDDKK